MFNFEKDTCNITMHRGDTGSVWIHAARKSGAEWTADDRCLFTVKNAQGEVVMQRIYRLDDQWGAGDGYFLMEFHNNDTDEWANGSYQCEWRYNIAPSWDGTAPMGRCVDGLTAGVRMVEGAVVRTVVQSNMTISDVYGEV